MVSSESGYFLTGRLFLRLMPSDAYNYYQFPYSSLTTQHLKPVAHKQLHNPVLHVRGFRVKR